MVNYTPTPAELRKNAALFWSAELTAKEASASILPILLQTQDKFISLLDVADASPTAWKDALTATSTLSANIFLKHLMVLADVGGELFKRLRPQWTALFPTGIMVYFWRETRHEYRFKRLLQATALDNKTLGVDGKSLATGRPLSELMEDAAIILLYGGAAIETDLPEVLKEKCIIGELLGRKAELERFVKQRYLLVSRITGGATSNALGQLAQDYVRDALKAELTDWTITRNGHIPKISHNAGKTDMSFDLVAQSPTGRIVAIEISFQVTTNSVIERKSGQAVSRAELLHKANHHIAYVLDGAGNFERVAALRTLCDNSDCTVTLTTQGMETLIHFLRSVG